MNNYETHNLIILDDKLHSYQHFASALKTVFPTLSDKAIRCMCALIHKSGSTVCARGCVERLEMCKMALERFSLNCVIEIRTR